MNLYTFTEVNSRGPIIANKIVLSRDEIIGAFTKWATKTLKRYAKKLQNIYAMRELDDAVASSLNVNGVANTSLLKGKDLTVNQIVQFLDVDAINSGILVETTDGQNLHCMACAMEVGIPRDVLVRVTTKHDGTFEPPTTDSYFFRPFKKPTKKLSIGDQFKQAAKEALYEYYTRNHKKAMDDTETYGNGYRGDFKSDLDFVMACFPASNIGSDIPKDILAKHGIFCVEFEAETAIEYNDRAGI